MKGCWALLVCPFMLFGLEEQPWFGDVYEFHFLGFYDYSRFHSIQNATPPYHQLFQSNLAYLGLDFSPSPVWSIDGDMQIAATTAEPFYFQSIALQARYLWLDDIIGDPITFTTGASGRVITTTALHDVSSMRHGNTDFEVNFSLGKEFDANYWWRFRAWAFGAVGHANRGSPWVRGTVAIEANIEDEHKFALYATGMNGYGGHKHINPYHFNGYAKIREKNIDLCFRYGFRIGVWGTIRFEYQRRLLAKACPQRVNSFVVGYLLPFSF